MKGSKYTTAGVAAGGGVIGYAVADLLEWGLLAATGIDMPDTVEGSLAVVILYVICRLAPEEGIKKIDKGGS
tara:strand:+ start:245 stop:460 length:216 start_codon:yes stop_codon:yes gene_type:complete